MLSRNSRIGVILPMIDAYMIAELMYKEPDEDSGNYDFYEAEGRSQGQEI